MSKTKVIVANILIIAVILAFVALYSSHESHERFNQQVEAFESASSTMEKVTENYLTGEQQICDVWARYINNNGLSMEEAAAFIRDSHVVPTASAHILYADTLSGLSTRPTSGTTDGYEVSYGGLEFLEDASWISETGAGVSVSPTYTNPADGVQSLAFCNRISLSEPDGQTREALLLRVIPVSEVEQKWVFPNDSYAEAELAIIDAEGRYIIRGSSFKNSNFFEFYKSYNDTDFGSLQELTDAILEGSGSFSMKDSHGRELIVSHDPIFGAGGWVLLSSNPADEFGSANQNWPLLLIVTLGLVILFALDLGYAQYLNRRYQEAAREAAAANRAKTDFLSTMSHDIRTPMNAIIGLTTIAERNIEDPEVVGENLRKISLASNHLLTLINDILDISKVESGKLNLSPLTFSIVETAENLVNLSQPMIKEKNLDFSFRINRMEKEYLYADQLRLNQIYINILSNAIKYTEPGGRVSVDLREEESEVEGAVKLRYIVSDTGVGMSPEFMKVMYEAFSRQIDSRVSSVQGTGLGLAITKQMVDLMGGSIECRSEVGVGTTFEIVIDLPIADRQREDMQLDPIEVLLVDDDEILLETASDSLESLGATTECARSGTEALSMIEHRHHAGNDYDVVILDWVMPDMDGVETIRRIRASIDERIPILLVSAYDWSDIEELAKQAGADGFISKPLFRSTLYDKINELLGMETKSLDPEDDYSDLEGLHILVAEDNDVNWEIVSALLGMFGIETDRAENGRIAVDVVAEAPEGSYELVFMDIQMPEMNGLDATRAIRKLERPWAASIPIIAMTADAFSENVAECMEAGMDGHIAKPIDIKLVIKEIRRIKEGRR